MLIVRPSVRFIWGTPNALKTIEQQGRLCYKSEARITRRSAKDFVSMLINNGHESVLEHAAACFQATVDRGVSHEWVRHRLASISQESTRYCNYGNKNKFGCKIRVIRPPLTGKDQNMVWKHACEAAESYYMELIRLGCSAQIARSVLPTCLKTELAFTANFREWRHFLRLRTPKKAHPQMREVAIMIGKKLKKMYAPVFADITWED